MATRKKAEPLVETGNQPMPDSGERVITAPAGSPFRKPVKPMTHADAMTAYGALSKRVEWEHTPEGQARTTGIDTTKGANLAQIHHMDNYDVKEGVGPRIYDRQLPGMADPDAAPRPPKWEELTDNQRAHTERRLMKFGTSITQMGADIGAQLDQAHERAKKYGGEAPYASRFYERGDEHRERLEDSARALGISPTIHAQMNAFTSPNTKFAIHREDGTVSYPNDEAAVHSVRWAQAGHDPQALTNDRNTTRSGTDRAQGYETNMRKAASAMSQHIAGVAPADWKFGENEHDAFSGSPKTGPYANSWNDTHPQFTVSDVHTGGGGAFPHLDTIKQITDDEGEIEKKKSGREKAIEQTPYAHSAIDFAMRQAMVQRNLGSVRRTQATQWGEEQLQRGESGLRGAPDPEVVYRRNGSQFKQLEGQQEMFPQEQPAAPEAPAPEAPAPKVQAGNAAGSYGTRARGKLRPLPTNPEEF